MTRLFSNKNRSFHLGPYPLERLKRRAGAPDLGRLPPMRALSFDDPNPASLAHAMQRTIGMFDVVRDGTCAPVGEIPDNPRERSNHLKGAGYYFDATMVGVCALPAAALLEAPIRNPMVGEIAAELERSVPKSFAAGMDMILADVKDSARTNHQSIDHHTHAIVLLVEYARDPRPGEPGTEWLTGTQAQRAAVLSAQTAVLLSTYLRMLGYEARAHSATCSDVDLGKLAVAAGLVAVEGEAARALANPYIGTRFGLAAVTTTLELAPDLPLAPRAERTPFDRLRSHGPAWWLGLGTLKGALNQDAYAKREFRMGPLPFETLKRVDQPTTFIDHARVPRFPKRADFFARVLFGDMGKSVQADGKNAHYVMKSPIGACARRALGALLLLQFGEARGPVAPGADDPQRNADNLKAASYYLSCDAVGLCAVPAWAYYSHDAGGNPMPAYHRNAVNMLFDQGRETMEAASGDDWISVAQSMRAYLRFSMIGGIIAEQVRRLGYAARTHTVIDGDVLQPGLLLLSGLGEVSRIGEVILNPFLGPRLKSGSVTTDMPMTPDKPIDFGMQRFCAQCNKCARECPSGAITAGPKLMYNGYEIWKSDAEKCARYRITNKGGGMCGRCMKTCPWNLEGLFSDAVFRWAAMNLPSQARRLAELDDWLDRGSINPVKKWWWDIELDRASGRYVRAAQTHARGLQKALDLKYAEQTLAVYPADTMPPPYPVAFAVNREAGIARYRALLTPEEYKLRLARGETEGLAPPFRMPAGPPPVFAVQLARREDMTPDIARFELVALEGRTLPRFDAGAHIDVVIAPEYLRQYSLAGDPADGSKYVLGLLREAHGRGGSALMHRAFHPGRRVFVSPPINQFPLEENARKSFLFAGGIGVTPLLTMAHRLHAIGGAFDFHYSAHSRGAASFLADIDAAPWRDRVTLHLTDEGSRADFAQLVPAYAEGFHLYTCGAARYMDGIYAVAEARGWPQAALHKEYFSVPEPPDTVNHPFTLKLARRGQTLDVPAERSATEVLADAGIQVETKCSDGICGTCAIPHLGGAIEHRDYVLSAKQRETKMILCCSRAAQPGGEIVVDL